MAGPLLWGPQNTSTSLQKAVRGPGADAPLMAIDPRKGFIIRENYVARNVGPAGSLGWTLVVNGSGAAGDMTSGSVSDGINQRFHTLESGVTTSSYAQLYMTLTSEGFAVNTDLDFELYCRVYLDALADATDDYEVYIGMGNTINGTEPTDGIYWKYDRDTAANWILSTVDSGASATHTDTGIAVAATTWTDLYWRFDSSAGEVRGYVNGVLGATNSTNIPTGTTPNIHIQQGITKEAGTTERVLNTTGFQLAYYDPAL